MEDRNLLISDVDGTLLGHPESLQRFCDWLEPRRDRLRLVYASGRFFDSVVESVRKTGLPAPDAIIGGVGTEVRAYPTGEPLGEWLADLSGWYRLNICATLAGYEEVTLQPAEFLSDFKISYFVHDADRRQIDAYQQQLAAVGCEVEMVYSSSRDLDVLPRGVNKGAAAGYLARLWETPPESVYVFGDSGNDRSLFDRGFRGTVVGNAQPELRSLTSRDVYQARQPYAAGVLEGLRHWLPDN